MGFFFKLDLIRPTLACGGRMTIIFFMGVFKTDPNEAIYQRKKNEQLKQTALNKYDYT
jgi:hypothetical protein